MTFVLLAGIVATSIVGSVHCVAMCGPLVGLHGGARSVRLALVHALGRMTTYVALGLVAGAVGSAIDLAGRVGNVQRVATLVAAGTIIALAIAQASGIRRQASGRNAFGTALVAIKTHKPAKRAWLMGVITGLIPCGWLWAFVVTAAGTGSVVGGGLVMVAFWLGTVPAMVGLLAFAGPVLARLRARMPAVTAIALIALGLGTLALRWRDAGAGQVARPHCALCHGAKA